jgi:uncharacterized protein (TIGR02466 family)
MRPPKIKNNQLEFAPYNHTVYQIFPTPFLRGELRLPHQQVAKDCEFLIGEIKKFDDDPKRYYTTYFHENVREMMRNTEWYTSFANQIKDTYIDFIRMSYDMKVDHLSRNDIHLFAWVSVWEEGITHTYHNHQDCLISGTYYPVNEGGQSIKFLSPNVHAQHPYGGQRIQDYKLDMPNTKGIGSGHSHIEMEINPTCGESMMWPSTLLHAVSEQQGDYRRVAISFNLKHNDPLTHTEDGEDLSYEFLQY